MNQGGRRSRAPTSSKYFHNSLCFYTCGNRYYFLLLNFFNKNFLIKKLILSLVCLSVFMLWTFQFVCLFVFGWDFLRNTKEPLIYYMCNKRRAKTTSCNLQEPSLNKISSLSFTTKYLEKPRRLFFIYEEAAFH